jgi:hypothetical protein
MAIDNQKLDLGYLTTLSTNLTNSSLSDIISEHLINATCINMHVNWLTPLNAGELFLGQSQDNDRKLVQSIHQTYSCELQYI